MKEVLVVSFAFPPMTSPASLRLSKLARYLPDYGWRPVVVTSDGGYSEYSAALALPRNDLLVRRVSDFDPVKKLTAGLIHQSGSAPATPPSWAKRLYRKLVPDRDWMWRFPALRAAQELMLERDIRVVYSSFPNITNHLVALELKTKFNRPWVAEFRDPWNHYEGASLGRFDLWKRWRERVEHRVCSSADFFLSVSPDYLAHFRCHHSLSEKASGVIYNGFDPRDFSFLTDSKPTSFPKFSIAHAGFFYEGRRSPEPLFKALHSLSQKGRINPEKVALDFYGPFDTTVDRLLTRFGLKKIATWHGILGYKEILPRLCREYCLLLIARHSFPAQLPRKLFDYMGTTRPILALTPDASEVASIVTRTGGGLAVDGNCPEDLERAFIRLWEKWISGDPGWVRYSQKDIRPFHSPEQARLLADIFDRVSA